MQTRRTMVMMTGALGALAALGGLFGWIANLRRGYGSVRMTSVAFELPRGACDAHVHVVGDPAEFPMSPERDYTPPTATATQLIQALKFLTLDRVVIVTPTIYGSDNSATLAAIAQLGLHRARGVGLVDETTSSATLDSMKQAGIVGVRLFLPSAKTSDTAAAAKRFQAKINLAKQRQWHLEISAPPDVVAALAAQFVGSPVPLVLDYFGWIAGGVEQPGFSAILSLLKSGHAYVKLAEPYRISGLAPDYQDLKPVVEAFVRANPNRLLWGSGWPHVDSASPNGLTRVAPNLPVDTGHLVNLFAKWVPDAETRHKILVENPARLYEFSPDS
jgi:predicted TIM-barrel fold metal-dependent hydrolase